MKKSISILTMLLLGMSAAAAGLSQLTLSISTQGPDYYADGTAVQTGEKYLLVYVSDGAVFAGIQPDGTLVDPVGNKIVTESVAVEGSKCEFKAIQYPPSLYPAGGDFLIVLLDTRNAAGVVGGLVAQLGTSDASGAASGDSTSLSSISLAATTASGAPALVASGIAAAPAGTQKPVITSLKGAGDAVELKVGNVSAAAVYEVQSTTDLSSGAWAPVAGGARLQLSAGGGAEVPVTLQVPQSDKVRFFRVIVPGSN